MEDDVQLQNLAKKLINIYNASKLSRSKLYLRKRKSSHRKSSNLLNDIPTTQSDSTIYVYSKFSNSKKVKHQAGALLGISERQLEKQRTQFECNKIYNNDRTINICNCRSYCGTLRQKKLQTEPEKVKRVNPRVRISCITTTHKQDACICTNPEPIDCCCCKNQLKHNTPVVQRPNDCIHKNYIEHKCQGLNEIPRQQFGTFKSKKAIPRQCYAPPIITHPQYPYYQPNPPQISDYGQCWCSNPPLPLSNSCCQCYSSAPTSTTDFFEYDYPMPSCCCLKPSTYTLCTCPPRYCPCCEPKPVSRCCKCCSPMPSVCCCEVKTYSQIEGIKNCCKNEQTIPVGRRIYGERIIIPACYNINEISTPLALSCEDSLSISEEMRCETLNEMPTKDYTFRESKNDISKTIEVFQGSSTPNEPLLCYSDKKEMAMPCCNLNNADNMLHVSDENSNRPVYRPTPKQTQRPNSCVRSAQYPQHEQSQELQCQKQVGDKCCRCRSIQPTSAPMTPINENETQCLWKQPSYKKGRNEKSCCRCPKENNASPPQVSNIPLGGATCQRPCCLYKQQEEQTGRQEDSCCYCQRDKDSKTKQCEEQSFQKPACKYKQSKKETSKDVSEKENNAPGWLEPCCLCKQTNGKISKEINACCYCSNEKNSKPIEKESRPKSFCLCKLTSDKISKETNACYCSNEKNSRPIEKDSCPKSCCLCQQPPEKKYDRSSCCHCKKVNNAKPHVLKPPIEKEPWQKSCCQCQQLSDKTYSCCYCKKKDNAYSQPPIVKEPCREPCCQCKKENSLPKQNPCCLCKQQSEKPPREDSICCCCQKKETSIPPQVIPIKPIAEKPLEESCCKCKEKPDKFSQSHKSCCCQKQENYPLQQAETKPAESKPCCPCKKKTSKITQEKNVCCCQKEKTAETVEVAKEKLIADIGAMQCPGDAPLPFLHVDSKYSSPSFIQSLLPKSEQPNIAHPCCSRPKGDGDQVAGVNPETEADIKATLYTIEKKLDEEVEMHKKNLRGIVQQLGKQACEIKELKVVVTSAVVEKKAISSKLVGDKIRKRDNRKEKEDAKRRKKAQEERERLQQKQPEDTGVCCACGKKTEQLGCCAECCAKRCCGCCGTCCGGCCVKCCECMCRPCQECCPCCCDLAECCDKCCSINCCPCFGNKKKKSCSCR